MAEITLTGNKKLASVAGEFWRAFPHLRLRFYPSEKKEAFDKGTAKPYHFEEFLQKKVSEARLKKGPDLSIRGNLKVKSLERIFWDDHGILASVEYIKSDGTWCFTGAAYDQLTLTELNRKGAAEGWLKDSNKV
jgi:hypothetical protein